MADVVTGNIVNITVGGTSIGLVQRESISISFGETVNEIELANQKRTDTVKGTDSPTIDISAFLSLSNDALEALNIVDGDGNFIRNEDRLIDSVKLEYLSDETGAVEAKHEFTKCEVEASDLDAGGNPATFSVTMYVNGTIDLDITSTS
jgi:hypothetical protein